MNDQLVQELLRRLREAERKIERLEAVEYPNASGVPPTRTITAGDGLTGGGDLSANRTIDMGTPGTVTAASSNGVTADSHTHAVTASSNPGAAASLLKSDANGALRLKRLGLNAAPSGDGHLDYAGDLKPYRGGTSYTGYLYVPCIPKLTSTSWDGDARSTTSWTKIDLSSVFGVPANVKAVQISMRARDSVAIGATNLRFYVGPNGSDISEILAPIGGDVLANIETTCPCDKNGDIYYNIVASGSGTMDCWLEIKGYYI